MLSLYSMLLSSYSENKIEAGCDEAGRGCLAGPVVAAGVILPRNYQNNLLNDSKKLSKKQREFLRIEIETRALSFAVGFVDHKVIDEINILNASFLAMHKAVNQLKIKPELLLIDGNRFKAYPNIPHECIVKGDGKFLSIAAASVLAKTYRDDYMNKLSEEYPGYGWNSNMGYPTVAHRKAIQKQGTSPYHRQSFRQLPIQHELFHTL